MTHPVEEDPPALLAGVALVRRAIRSVRDSVGLVGTRRQVRVGRRAHATLPSLGHVNMVLLVEEVVTIHLDVGVHSLNTTDWVSGWWLVGVGGEVVAGIFEPRPS